MSTWRLLQTRNRCTVNIYNSIVLLSSFGSQNSDMSRDGADEATVTAKTDKVFDSVNFKQVKHHSL
jgi:hypothetical protein